MNNKENIYPTHLEVTLRDGGYQNNWNFTQEQAGVIVSQLFDAGIKWIEIGYRNCPPQELNPGLTGRCPNSYISYLRNVAPKAKFSVMYSPSLISKDDIDQMVTLGVDMVRCTMPNEDEELSLPLIKYAYDKGIVSTANLTQVTEYKFPDLIDKCKRIWDNGCSVIYVADTNGCLTPRKAKQIFNDLKSALPSNLKLGFHNHNMLNMAMANAIAAIEEGIDFIDSSLRGMGRSSGNVQTESYVAWLALEKCIPIHNSSIPNIIRVANYLDLCFIEATPHPNLQDFCYGAYDFFSLVGAEVTEVAIEYNISWFDLILAMDKANLDKPKITKDIIREVARNIIKNK